MPTTTTRSSNSRPVAALSRSPRALTPPTVPWRPSRLIVSPPSRKITVTRPKGPIFGDPKVDDRGEPLLDPKGNPLRERLGWRTPGKEVPCWDLIFYVDGQRYFERFPKAGLADAIKLKLEA